MGQHPHFFWTNIIFDWTLYKLSIGKLCQNIDFNASNTRLCRKGVNTRGVGSPRTTTARGEGWTPMGRRMPLQPANQCLMIVPWVGEKLDSCGLFNLTSICCVCKEKNC